MTAGALAKKSRCWCGNVDLVDFSATYSRCLECETLVSLGGLSADEAEVRDDARDFYGKTYWLSHQRLDLGLPDIHERARLDLPERCLHWLRALLSYRRPPAQVLEVGSGHGAFVALMRWAGFDATGLEVSPWVVDFARETFAVPVLLGRIEAPPLPLAGQDVVVLNDVLEHLVSPVEAMQRCAALLRPDGIVLVQTPCYPEGHPYQHLVETADPFLAMLQEREHLYLFSQRAVRRLVAQVGLEAIRFEPARFPYDMFFLAGRRGIEPLPPTERDEALVRSAAARMVGAMLDLDERAGALSRELQDVENDRQERLRQIERLTRHIEQVSLDSEARLDVIRDQQANIERLTRHIEQVSLDSEARLDVIRDQQANIERLGGELARAAADLQARQQLLDERATTIAELARQHAAIEAILELERQRGPLARLLRSWRRS